MRDTTNRDGADARSPAGLRAGAIVVAGPPASGKTTLGAALAGRLHYAFFDLDIVTGPLTRAALALAGADETALRGPLGARLRDARYGALLDAAAANLALGLSVVICAPFTRERADESRFAELAARLRAPAVLISLELDAGERTRRMRDRGAARDASLDDAGQDAPASAIAEAIVVDGAGPPQDTLEAALAALARRPAFAAPLPSRSPGPEPSAARC